MNLLKKVAVSISTLAMVSVAFVASPAALNAASPGEVYSTSDGTVWFITKDMQKRPFTSAGAFNSYGFLSFSQVKAADASVEALPTGSFIAPADGRIFCATETKGSDVAGECSLVTGGMKAAFTSAAVFTGRGYSFDRAAYGDSSFLSKTTDISNTTDAHRMGVLVNNGGTVQMVVSGGLWGIPSIDVFNSWGYSFADVVPANSADTAMSQIGVIPGRMAGELVPTGVTGGGDETPSDCNVDGDSGDITLTDLSTYSVESVGEGEDDVPVYSFDIEADDSSDLLIRSIKVELAQQTAADSDRLDDYASEVSIWMNGEMVGSADADEFTENNDVYTKSISLDDCTIVDAGDEVEFVIAVSALNNLDSGDIDSDDWQVGVSQVRYEDGDGVVSTETSTLDVADDTLDDALEEAFEFEDFAGAADIDVKVALSDNDDVNDAHVVDIDDTEDTKDVEVLSFTIEAGGDSDITVKEIPATITTTGETDEAVLLTRASLWMDGDRLASDTVPTGGAVVFEDLDIAIDAEEEVELVITVDIQDTTGAADNGDTVQVSVTSANADAMDIEDEAGDDVVAADISGAAVGDTHAVYDAGIMATFVEASAVRTFTADATGEDDQGTYTIVFDVTAFDGDMYIDDDCEDDNGTDAAGQGTVFDVNSTAGTPTGGGTCLVDAAGSESGDTANSWEVKEGETRRFTFTVTLTADSTPTDGNHQVILESINWDNEAGGVDSTPDFFYNFNMDDFETPYLFLNGIG
ncbi:MAG: hypothetical protein R3B41_00975 [Candidatus Doudnabacteria bacterium]